MRRGDRVGRYELLDALGKGGMGEVYAARDTALGRRVAVKILVVNEGAANERFAREARAVAAFAHPNAIVVHDIGEHQGAPYIVMELVEGKTLRKLLGEDSIPLARRVRWAVDVARALGAAHRAGLVHRDVKPSNVMVRDDGVVKVLDFGVARSFKGSPETQADLRALGTLTETGVVVGTPRYSSPEQLRGKPVDGRSDQFAWGILVYELLAGRYPWPLLEGVPLMAEIVGGQLPPMNPPAEEREPVPPEVEQVIQRALEKEPDARFATMDEAADALEAFAEAAPGVQVSAVPSSMRPPPPPPPADADVAKTDLGAAPSAIEEDAGTTTTGEMASASSRREAAPPRGKGSSGRSRKAAWATAGIVAVALAGVGFGGLTGRLSRWPWPRTRATATVEAPRPPAPIEALACKSAVILQQEASPDMARALGVGACARLGIELGVRWGDPSATQAVEVTAALGAASAEVTIAVAGQKASGKGSTPLEAADAAVQAIAPSLPAPPVTDADIKAWGAQDAAGAQRVRRAWRRFVTGMATDLRGEARRLCTSDPGSPFAHMLGLLTAPPGSAEAEAHRDKARAALQALPPARSQAMLGGLLGNFGPHDRKEALRLTREAYEMAPDDSEVALIYVHTALDVGTLEESVAVAERFSERFPESSVAMLRSVIRTGLTKDLDQDERLLGRLSAILPESGGWSMAVGQKLDRAQFDEARAAVEQGRRLGLWVGVQVRLPAEALRAPLELSALAPEAAREAAQRVLAVPSPEAGLLSLQWTAASYEMQGRLIDAETARARALGKLREAGAPLAMPSLLLEGPRVDRWLGKAPQVNESLDALEAALSKLDQEQELTRVRAEIATARALAEGAAWRLKAKETLDTLETFARERAAGDRARLDSMLLSTLPLLRVVRGHAAAAALWRSADRAAFRVRRDVAYDAALALEAAGDRAGAEAAYSLAQDPYGIEEHAFSVVAARLRLARMYKLARRDADAAALTAVVDRLWAGADPGLRDAVLRAL